MNKRVLVFQVIACVLIMGIVGVSSVSNNKYINKAVGVFNKEITRVVTIEDVKATGTKVIETIKNTPSKVVSAIVSVNQVSEYGEPIDKISSEEIKQVHAVSGGMVLSSGIDRAIGMYVKIQHEDAVSVYGNLTDIRVAEDERVKRGEIIGSFDSASGSDFYYNLEVVD